MLTIQHFTFPDRNPLSVSVKYPSISVKFANPENGIAKFQVSLSSETEYSKAMDVFTKMGCISSGQPESSQRAQPVKFCSQINFPTSLFDGFSRESMTEFDNLNKEIAVETGNDSLAATTAEQLSEMDPSQLSKIISQRLKLPHMKRLVSDIV